MKVLIFIAGTYIYARLIKNHYYQIVDDYISKVIQVSADSIVHKTVCGINSVIFTRECSIYKPQKYTNNKLISIDTADDIIGYETIETNGSSGKVIENIVRDNSYIVKINNKYYNLGTDKEAIKENISNIYNIPINICSFIEKISIAAFIGVSTYYAINSVYSGYLYFRSNYLIFHHGIHNIRQHTNNIRYHVDIIRRLVGPTNDNELRHHFNEALSMIRKLDIAGKEIDTIDKYLWDIAKHY